MFFFVFWEARATGTKRIQRATARHDSEGLSHAGNELSRSQNRGRSKAHTPGYRAAPQILKTHELGCLKNFAGVTKLAGRVRGKILIGREGGIRPVFKINKLLHSEIGSNLGRRLESEALSNEWRTDGTAGAIHSSRVVLPSR